MLTYKTPLLALAILWFVSLADCQLAPEWSTTYNGQGDFSDVFNCVVADGLGNYYLGGATQQEGHNSDYLIVKKDSENNVIWSRIYNAPGNGPDEVKDIVRLPDGKIVVTGYGNNLEVGNDFWTMCFSSDGDSLWSNLYNDPSFNQYDEAEALDFDSAGNIYITGESDSDVTGLVNKDALTIKLSSSGQVLWAKRYDGTGSGLDRGEDIAVSSNDEIFITGRTDNGNDDDYLTIKYTSAGVESWVELVDNGGTDRATAIGADNSDNIYVTGRRNNGNDDDFYTVKYDSNGNQVLTKQFDFVDDDRAEAIAVNSDGSFVVTGRSDVNANATINWNYYTVSYSSTGTQLWANTYNGPSNGDDVPTAVAIDNAGNIAVTGYSDVDPGTTVVADISTVLYNSGGVQTWSSSADSQGLDDRGHAVIFIADGTPMVCGYATANNAQSDALSGPYSGAGVLTSLLYSGSGDNSDNLREGVTDALGSIYVCGYTVKKGDDRDLLVIKLSSVGDTLWTRTFSGTMFGSDDDANAIALTASGVVVSGYVKNSQTGSDIFLASIDAGGNILWSVQWNSEIGESDRAYDLVTDASGNIYLTGRTDIDPLYTTNDECILIKFSSTGQFLWQTTYVGGVQGSERGKLTRINAGNIIVGARINDGVDDNMAVLSYNSTGQLLWSYSFDSYPGNDDIRDLEIAPSGQILLCGVVETAPGVYDIVTSALSSAGELLWTQSEASSENEEVIALDIDNAGNCVITGYQDVVPGIETNFDLVTRMYDSTGATSWTHILSNPNGLDDIADDVVIYGDYIHIAGHTNNGTLTDIDYDALAIMLDNSGDQAFDTSFAPSDSSDVPNFILPHTTGFYLCGSTWNLAEQRNCFINNYTYTTSVSAIATNELLVFPNPFNEQIRLSSPEIISHVSICDTSGETVYDAQTNASFLTIVGLATLAPGYYLLNITSQGKTNTYKLAHI
jgi:uncharacterized delta-60 repeat protein